MEITVDLDKIIQAKAGAKAKCIPKFLINKLKKIIHQDEINQYFWDSRNLKGKEWLEDGMRYLDLTLKVKNEENLPKDNEKRYIFVSNHPLGGPDGVALGYLLTQHYGNRLRVPVNDFLMYIPGYAPLCVPVNKVGGQTRQNKLLLDEAYESENHILLFPAGLCSRMQKNGEIRDVEWSKNFIQRSIQCQRDVVPLYFDGRNSQRFYNIARWCKRLRLKFNLAMVYLPDEMYRNRHKTFTVTVGKPIPWQTFDKSITPRQWAQKVKEEVYNLKDNGREENHRSNL